MPHNVKEYGYVSLSVETLDLLLPCQIQSRGLQQTMTVVYLDNVPISAQLPILSHLDIVLSGVLGKSPLQALENLLPTRELELAPSNGLHHVRLGRILPANGQQDLSDVDAGGHADGLAVRVPHPAGQSIRPGAAKHLVGPDDVEGVDAHPDVIPVLANGVGEVLVDGDAAGLQGLAGDLLLLVAHQVADEGKEVDGGLLRANVVDLDLGLGDTAAVTGLDVGLILLVAVAAERTTTHVDEVI